jgi:rhodanese-related sulfurtransferase
VNTTLEEAVEQIAKRTTDKKHPILIICEDGKASAELGKKLVEDHYLNVVVLEGGVTSVNKTSLI